MFFVTGNQLLVSSLSCRQGPMIMLMFCMIFEGMCLLLMLMFMPTLMFCVMQVPADVDVDNVYACGC